MGLNASPPIWQTYVNAILNSLQSRKYCEAIMDDLLLFMSSKKAHIAKLEAYFEGIKKEWFEDISKGSVNYLGLNCSI